MKWVQCAVNDKYMLVHILGEGVHILGLHVTPTILTLYPSAYLAVYLAFLLSTFICNSL